MSLSVSGLNPYLDSANNTTMNTVNGLDKTSGLEDTLATDLSKANDEELLKACKDFESYFTEQIFKSMQKMVPESKENTSAYTTQLQDYFKDDMMKTMAEDSADKGNLGLAQMLFEQMKRNNNMA
jgi:flagellar protein FlgJ